MVSPTLASVNPYFDAFLSILINGVSVSTTGPSSGATNLGAIYSTAWAVVPPGATYQAQYGSYGYVLAKWFELR
jgi:hypothetical protein